MASTITAAMNNALQAAVTNMNTILAGKKLDDLTLAQLQPIIQGFKDAYAVYAAGITPPTGIDLNASSGISVLDGWNTFTTEVVDVATECDINLALAYLQRIINNLTMASG